MGQQEEQTQTDEAPQQSEPVAVSPTQGDAVGPPRAPVLADERDLRDAQRHRNQEREALDAGAGAKRGHGGLAERRHQPRDDAEGEGPQQVGQRGRRAHVKDPAPR